MIDRYRGSLLGLAIGDALGVPIEFQEPGSFEPISDFKDADYSNLPAGHWSDDTAMALCLANSLIEKSGFDPVDQIEKYSKWLREGYCSSTGVAQGVGQTIHRALSLYRSGGDPYVAINTQNSDGNGSLMRLAPIPLYFRNQPDKALEYAVLSSKITHGSIICGDACRYYSGLIIGALNAVSKEDLLLELYHPVNRRWGENDFCDEIKVVAMGSFKNNEPPIIKGSGYVVKSLESALWAFFNSDSFEEGVLKAVNLGDDADTTGAIYGQLAGAYYGLENIPQRWRNGVAKRDSILELAEKLLNESER